MSQFGITFWHDSDKLTRLVGPQQSSDNAFQVTTVRSVLSSLKKRWSGTVIHAETLRHPDLSSAGITSEDPACRTLSRRLRVTQP